MQKDTIITISRQFGSGGREIAKALSEALSIPFYDKEIITEAAKESGLDENLFKNPDERPTTSLLYSIAAGIYPVAGSIPSMPDINEAVFRIQSKVITELAQKGACVFVGRCADYVLNAFPDCHRFFIYAGEDYKTERVMQVYGMEKKAATDLIAKTDKKRAAYYNYYTGRKWNTFANYDICINSEKTGITGAKDMILSYIRMKENI